jgi:hypothetical protein
LSYLSDSYADVWIGILAILGKRALLSTHTTYSWLTDLSLAVYSNSVMASLNIRIIYRNFDEQALRNSFALFSEDSVGTYPFSVRLPFKALTQSNPQIGVGRSPCDVEFAAPNSTNQLAGASSRSYPTSSSDASTCDSTRSTPGDQTSVELKS